MFQGKALSEQKYNGFPSLNENNAVVHSNLYDNGYNSLYQRRNRQEIDIWKNEQ